MAASKDAVHEIASAHPSVIVTPAKRSLTNDGVDEEGKMMQKDISKSGDMYNAGISVTNAPISPLPGTPRLMNPYSPTLKTPTKTSIHYEKVGNRRVVTEICYKTPKGTALMCGVIKNGVKCNTFNDEVNVERAFKCSGCNEYSIDSSLRYIDPVDMEPEFTEQDEETFESVSILLDTAVCMMRENGGVSTESLDIVAKIKKISIVGGLLLPDGYTRVWNDHKPLQEALTNCVTAVNRTDKVGFRNAFFSMLFHLTVSYPLNRPERRVANKEELNSENLASVFVNSDAHQPIFVRISHHCKQNTNQGI